MEPDTTSGEENRNHLIDDTDRHDIELSLRRTMSRVMIANEHAVDAALTAERLQGLQHQPTLESKIEDDSGASDDNYVCRSGIIKSNSASNWTNSLRAHDFRSVIQDTTSQLCETTPGLRSPLVVSAAS